MFHPDQAKRLTAHTQSDGAGQEFEGQIILQKTWIPAQSNTAIERVVIGHFYKPDQIIGTPFEPHCLAGIDAYPIHGTQGRFHHVDRACVIGAQTVIDESGNLYAPDLVSTPEQIAALFDVAGTGYLGCAVTKTDQGYSVTYGGRDRPRHFSSTALFFHNLESSNFGSFVFRQLPQMVRAAKQKLEFDCYIVGDRTAWCLEMIRLLGLPEKPVFTVREVCGETFNRVIFSGDLSAEGFIDPDTVAYCRDLADALPGGTAEGGKKVYVSRALSGVGRRQYRHMINEIEVEDILRRRGYEIVYPESLSLTQQMRSLRGARVVIGPSGSGMFNTIFAPPGCRIVDIETYHHTVRQHAKLYASLGHPYVFLFADMDPLDTSDPVCRRSILRIEDLEAAIAWAEAGRGD